MPNNPDILAYTGEVGGLSTLIGYYFVDNMLYRGGYIFQEEHSNKNIFMIKILIKITIKIIY